MENWRSRTFKAVDNSVDNSVDNFFAQKFSTGFPQGFPQVFHRVFHRVFHSPLARALFINRPLDTVDNCAQFLITLQSLFNRAARIQHGGMILAPKPHADHWI